MTSTNHMSGNELRRSLNLVILGVTFGITFFVVTGGPPITGFSRALGAGDLVYGIIMAMPVVGGVLQVFASYFLENTGKRKYIFLRFGVMHRFLWIPLAIIPFVIPPSYSVLRIWAVIVLITLSSACNSITGVCFLSWMGALVPLDIRGKFFSKRTMILTISSAASGMAAGKFIDMVPGFNGFAIVFIVVALLGIADILCFIWVKDPPMEVPKEKIPFFKLFVEPFANKNYMKFITFVSIWMFGVNFSGPFFNVYMLEYLNMSYFTMSIFAQVIGNIATILFIRQWGKLVDRFGNKPIMAVCCCGIISLPILWFFATPQNYLIVLFINFTAGIFWPGYEMAALNLSIWIAPEKNRSIYLATYTLITSIIGIALPFVCGGGFMELLRPIVQSLDISFIMGQKLNSFHLLFTVSCLIRMVATLFFLPRFKEENSRSVWEMIDSVKNSLKLRISSFKNEA